MNREILISRPRAVAVSLALVLGIMVSAIGAPAWSQIRDGARTATISVDIPAQSLDSALERFSQISSMQMLYDANLTAGRRSTTVSGRYSVQDALVRLLEGTGLRARFTAGGSVVITPALPADMTLDMLHVQPPPVIGGQAAFLSYVDVVRRDIEAALQADAELSKGNYRISLRLWLDAEGRVARSEVIASSASSAINSRFRAVLRSIRVSQTPPESLPLPMRIEFIVR